MNRPLICTAVLATLSACLVASPAAAAPANPPACATGAITAFAGTVSTLGAPSVSVSGWMQPCATTLLPDTFDIIYFNSAVGVVTPSRILPFQSVSQPTPFTTAASYSTYRSSATGAVTTEELPVAICVARRDLARLDCVRVEFLGADQPPLVYRIPVDDPVVRKIVIYGPDTDVDHGCGNCV